VKESSTRSRVTSSHTADQDRAQAVEGHRSSRIVSPELVLVDDELAAWCRLSLREDAVAAAALEDASGAVAAATAPRPSPHEVDERLAAAEETSQRLETRRLSGPRALAMVAVLVTVGAAAAWALLPTGHGLQHVLPGGARTRATVGDSNIILAWPYVPNARFYVVTMFRGNSKVFEARVSRKLRLTLPHDWRMNGHEHRLERGTYHLSVEAVIRGRASPRTTTIVRGPLAVDVTQTPTERTRTP